MRIAARARVSGRRLLVLAAGAVLLMAPLAALWIPRGFDSLTVDGRDDEWRRSGVVRFTATEPSSEPSLDLESYAVHRFGGDLGIWVQVRGTLFADPAGYDTVHVFLDADGDASSGYRHGGLGADYRVGVTGGKGRVESAILYRFNSMDRDDWRGWRPESGLRFGWAASALEVAVPVRVLAGFVPTFLAAFVVEGNDGQGSSSSLSVGDGPSAVRMSLQGGTTVVDVGDEIASLAVQVEGFGGCRIEGLAFANPSGAAFQLPTLPILLPGHPASVQVPVFLADSGGARAGEALSLRVEDVVATCPVTWDPGPAGAYFRAAPGGHRIDGLFEEWRGHELPAPGPSPGDANVDLVAYSIASDASSVYAYARVAGRALAGGRVPSLERPRDVDATQARVVAATGVARRSAEDRLVAWIDVDPGAGTGEPRGDLGIDWWVEIAGRRGEATSAVAFPWSGEGWASGVPIDVAVAGSEVEFAIRGPAGDPVVILDLWDWRGVGETTSPARLGTRSQVLPELPVIWPPIEWPPGFFSRVTDPDEGLDPSVEILEVQTYNRLPLHLFVRILVQASAPVLADHTWWVYLDATFGDGNNDWLVVEMSGRRAVCTLLWDWTNADWGITGNPCDFADSIRDTDPGSAVRVVPNCVGVYGCIDFALERSDYPGLGWFPYVTVAADLVEDLGLVGDTHRNPTDAAGGCSVPEFDDCSVRTIVDIPEFTSFAVPAAATLAGFLAMGRVRAGRRPRSAGRRGG